MKEISPSRENGAVAGYDIKVPRREVRTLIHAVAWSRGKPRAIVAPGIDPAKNVFAAYGVDATVTPARAAPLLEAGQPVRRAVDKPDVTALM